MNHISDLAVINRFMRAVGDNIDVPSLASTIVKCQIFHAFSEEDNGDGDWVVYGAALIKPENLSIGFNIEDEEVVIHSTDGEAGAFVRIRWSVQDALPDFLRGDDLVGEIQRS